MSSSSDLDVDTPIAEQAASQEKESTKKGKKKKKEKQTKVVATDHGKNEGDDPHWAYAPPEGASLLDHTVDAGPFEWDAIKSDEDTEIWLVRVPESIKPKHLKGLELDAPSSSRTARIGGLTRKDVPYDVWSIGSDDADVAGGEELRGLACLLPRKRKDGKLYIAPKQASRHIVISACPPIPTPPEYAPVVHQNPPRPCYPKDVLKHAFLPYGARAAQTQPADASMDVDGTTVTVVKPIEKPPSSKGKKRKVDGDSPKKAKRRKAES